MLGLEAEFLVRATVTEASVSVMVGIAGRMRGRDT